MARNITVTFGDGTSHIYRNAPDDVTPDMVQSRAEKEFSKSVTGINGGRGASADSAPASLVDQIPGLAPKVTPETEVTPGIADRLAGIPEAAASIATGAIAAPIGYAAGALKGLTGGKYGTPEGVREAQKYAQDVAQSATYQPRSQTGQDVVGGISSALDASKLAGLPIAGAEMPALAQAARQQAGLVRTIPRVIAESPEAYAAGRVIDAVKPKGPKPLNSVALETVERAKEAGYVIPPSSVNPSFKNTMVESIAGKIATAQEASNRNQVVTEKLARRALGISNDAPLSSETISTVKREAYEKGYSPIAQIGTIATDQKFKSALDSIVSKYQGAARSFPGVVSDEVNNLINGVPGMHGGERTGGMRVQQFDSSDALQAIQVLRDEASAAFTKGEPGVGIAKRQVAKAIEDQIERNLESGGSQSSKMLETFRESRKLIAKAHSVDEAIREGTGTLDAKALARQLQRGDPLSDELETIARFANTFEKANQRPGQVAGPGVHNLRAFAAASGGGIGAMLGGPVGAVVGGAAPFVVPQATRNYLLSPGAQNRLVAAISPKKAVQSQPSGLTLDPIGSSYEAGGFPKKEFQSRNVLTLADDSSPAKNAFVYEGAVDFPLRQEALLMPEVQSVISAAVKKSDDLQRVIKNAISPAVRAKAEKELSTVQQEFAAFMREYGIESPQDATGLSRKLYESGRTQLPVKKTFSPRNALTDR